MFLGTRRPKSHNVSIESLNGLGIDDGSIRLEIPTITKDFQQFCCPCDEQCEEKVYSSNLNRHVADCHKTPIISFGQSLAEIGLPPKPPIENACLVLTHDDQHFWIKLKFSNGQYFIAALMQNSPAEAFRYYLEVKIGNMESEKIRTKEIVTRCAVHSLQQMSWRVCIIFLLNKMGKIRFNYYS